VPPMRHSRQSQRRSRASAPAAPLGGRPKPPRRWRHCYAVQVTSQRSEAEARPPSAACGQIRRPARRQAVVHPQGRSGRQGTYYQPWWARTAP
jgi:hypothetical protein